MPLSSTAFTEGDTLPGKPLSNGNKNERHEDQLPAIDVRLRGIDAIDAPALSPEDDLRSLIKEWPSEDRRTVLFALYHFAMHLERLHDPVTSEHDRLRHRVEADKHWDAAFRICQHHKPEGGILLSRIDDSQSHAIVQLLATAWNREESAQARRGPDDIIDTLIQQLQRWWKSWQ